MSYVIASERSAAPPTRRRQQPSHIIPSTDCLDLAYDSRTRALWIYLSLRAPAYVSLELIEDLLGVDNVFATSLAVRSDDEPEIEFKVIASKRPGVFSLGGDLASFRYFVDQGNRNALTAYANAALDAIWTNTQAGIDGMTTVSLVQGEAQGGGFEAALSAHVLVAEKGAMFGFPEALFGMFPGMGGYALLSARTNADCARRLIGSTNRYPAEMLYEMGVIDVLAEAGEGRETVDEWILGATPDEVEKYRTRFADLNREQLRDSIDEWVEQALCLSPRQLRTMGYILEAQKRASAKSPGASVTPLRRKIEFADITTAELKEVSDCPTPSPLLITPQTPKRYHEREFLAFVKRSRPWIYETLVQHGAVVLRDFCDREVGSLNRLAAALRSNRTFKPSNAVPTPAMVHDNVFVDDSWCAGPAKVPHSEFSDCPVFPAYKLLACDGNSDAPGVSISIASSRAVYERLDSVLLSEFERRGLTYRRRFPSREANTNAETTRYSPDWQSAFKTESRNEVERKCGDNALNYVWHPDNSIEVFNSAPACISHPETGQRLWFNHVHFFRSFSSAPAGQRSLFSRLFSPSKLSAAALYVTFSDGCEIPRDYLNAIDNAYTAATLSFEICPGDALLVDNVLSATGHAFREQSDLRLIYALF